MNKLIKAFLTCTIIFLAGCNLFPEKSKKPVIYLYPEKTTEVDVKVNLDGTFTTTYPKYNDGWKVVAEPDGTLHALDNKNSYYCLFWEGVVNYTPDFSTGFVVEGAKTESFLEEALTKLGLNDRERNEFIIYWLPYMQENAYNLISFQNENYTDRAELDISPKPDTVIRVMMAWKPLKESTMIQPQQLDSVERNRFMVIEWGGTEYKS